MLTQILLTPSVTTSRLRTQGKVLNRSPSPPQPLGPRQLVNQRSQEKGLEAERQAQILLENAGYRCIARRLRCRFGEIDLVMAKGLTMVCVEVRYRHSNRFGGAAASITPKKWRRIVLTTRFWLHYLAQRHFGGHTPFCRYDVMTQTPDGLNWLQDAWQVT